jgi:hypothetical protein
MSLEPKHTRQTQERSVEPMWLAACLILAISLAAIVGWALQRFRPSVFSRYPGGIAEFTRRGKLLVPVYLLSALMVGALTSRIPILFVSALAFFMIGIPVLSVVYVQLEFRSRWSNKPGKRLLPAEMQEALKRRQLREAEKRQQRWRQQLDWLVFPYELVPGDQAEAAYEAARVKGQVEGYTPLIITPASWPVAPSLSRDDLMTEARRVIDAAPPAQEFFAERMTDWSRYDEDGERQRWLTEAPAFVAEPIESMRDLNDHMSTLRDTLGEKPPLPYVQEAALVRIPTPRSWEIPAYTLYGGWNACPNSEQMVAVARHWNEKYGADICALGDGTIEFRVERPPADPREALELVREQMLFCDEGVYDLIAVPEFLRETVLHLPKQRYWLFWWD